MKILICGASGSGKTQYLKELEKRISTSWTCKDLDEALAENNGVAPSELGKLISTKGWPWFRREEQKYILEFLENDSNGILALGGGSLSEELLNSHQNMFTLYWLDTSVDLCWERISSDLNRPLVSLGRESFFESYDERKKLYSQGQELPDIEDFAQKLEI